MSGTGLPPTSPPSWDTPFRGHVEPGGGPQRVRPWSKAAVSSFVLGLIGAVPLGLLFGRIGLSATGKYDDKQGRGFAWAGIALSLVWAAVFVLLIALRSAGGPSRGHDGAVTTAGTADVFDLQLGDCLQAPSAGDVTRVEVIPCTSAHDAQVFAIVQPTVEAYDSAAIDTQVKQMCTQEAHTAITSKNPYDVLFLAPSERGWDGGQHIGMCLLRSSVPLTGSVVAS